MHSVLLARGAYTVRMQSAHRAHMLKNPTNAQRVASARNEWPPHEARMKRACSAHAQRTASERRLYGFIMLGRRAKASSPTKNGAHPGCRGEEVLDQGSLDYHLQHIPSALMHCRPTFEHLMLIPYRRSVSAQMNL